MFFNVFITVLVSTLVFNERKYVFCTDKNKIIDTLLKHPGWDEISSLVRFPGTAGNSFSVRNLLNRNIAESSESVNDNYYTIKYNTIAFSLSCVYANSLIKLIYLTKTVLNVAQRERRRLCEKKSRERSIYKKQTECEEHDVQAKEDDLDETDQLPSNEHINDLVDSWKIVESVIRRFQKNWFMFDYMFEAFRFLKGLVSQEYFGTHLPALLHLYNALLYYKGKSTNLTSISSASIEEDKHSYVDKMGVINRNFHLLLRFAPTGPLIDFLNNYCIIPETDKPRIVEEKDVYSTFYQKSMFTRCRPEKEAIFQVVQQLEVQIETLVEHVIGNYFNDLGFVFDASKRNTS